MKAFYMKPDPERPEVALCVDVLAPEGYGEIIGGGQRIDDYDLLRVAHRGAQAAEGSVRVVPRPAPLRQRAARRLRHGHRARRQLDLRDRASARSDSVSADVVSDLSVTTLCMQSYAITMKIGFLSLGCPKNLVDGEVMLGIARDAGHELTPDASRGRRARRQYLRVHRSRQAGVNRRHPRNGGAQEERQLLAPGGHRLPRGTLSRRAEEGDSRDRCGARHGRSAADS